MSAVENKQSKTVCLVESCGTRKFCNLGPVRADVAKKSVCCDVTHLVLVRSRCRFILPKKSSAFESRASHTAIKPSHGMPSVLRISNIHFHSAVHVDVLFCVQFTIRLSASAVWHPTNPDPVLCCVWCPHSPHARAHINTNHFMEQICVAFERIQREK